MSKNNNNYSTDVSITKRTRYQFGRISKCSLVIGLVLASLLLDDNTRHAKAEDSGSGGLDMGALASLASNLGSNPQLMNMVSNFLNPDSQKSGVQASATSGSSAAAEVNSAQDTAAKGAPRQQQPPDQSAAAASASAGRPSGPAQSSSSPLGNIASMLPSLNLASLGNMGGLGGLLSGIGNKPQQQAVDGSTSAAVTAQAAPLQSAPPPMPVQAPPAPPVAAASLVLPPSTATTAQSVINQVLTAYAAGQIPNELIQLSLSGRVPPQLIELALSGQVPPQMIQMIITGQVPMSTINSFLSSFQQTNEQAAKASRGPSYSAEGNVVGGQSAPVGGGASTNTGISATPPGVWSTTRTLFEALFGVRRDINGKASISVPTLMGNIPVRVPSIGSNVRNFGHLVGGTISNMASMIPF